MKYIATMPDGTTRRVWKDYDGIWVIEGESGLDASRLSDLRRWALELRGITIKGHRDPKPKPEPVYQTILSGRLHFNGGKPYITFH